MYLLTFLKFPEFLEKREGTGSLRDKVISISRENVNLTLVITRKDEKTQDAERPLLVPPAKAPRR
jgi:hypothetical protein